jgi:hypothetical protein
MGGFRMSRRMYLNDAAKALEVAPYALRTMAKTGGIPCWKSGNRYIFDIEQCEEYLRNKAMENVEKIEEPTQYGVLRKIKAN